MQKDDVIYRQAAIDAIEFGITYGKVINKETGEVRELFQASNDELRKAADRIKQLPPVQSELCEYYALCRHGRDESKLRSRLKFCEYCNEDSDGYVKPIEKNGHAFVRFGRNGWVISLRANGWHGECKIRYCPMCGRDLLVK